MMTPDATSDFGARAAHELAAGTSLLTVDRDVIGTVTMLLAGCRRATGANAAGALIAVPQTAGLELLATSGEAGGAMLPLWQTQVSDGPSSDVVRTGEPRWAQADSDEWPELAAALRAGELHSLQCSPMRWANATIGVMDLTFESGGELMLGVESVAQAFADLATLAVVLPNQMAPGQIVEQLRAVLDKRAVIEQAKGAIAYTEGVTVDEAFDRLMRRAAEQNQSLTTVAARTVGAMVTRTSPS